ncbi:hypothetical protein LPA44_04185 [Halobacterium sp. KA-4]|uniref:hypothetical protein n=1 Tax=Halobacterium sp. KA-4 TaxID=2896367 RepID=UPI001E589E28|nr:hypothetical protein [Halobacterium sp. KA-4]MCD2199098.1 hypothetical protein [Halobacterium sp. KA-4]
MTDTPPLSEPLDFLSERDDHTGSWTRGDPDDALIESLNRYGWVVTLPDGDTHECALARERGAYVGWCDCDGYRYHDGPCAHLCALRKADFVNDHDVEDQPIRIPDTESSPEPVTDGGQPVEPAAGHDGRQFGRPEGRL